VKNGKKNNNEDHFPRTHLNYLLFFNWSPKLHPAQS
jgi:hypothetical protein